MIKKLFKKLVNFQKKFLKKILHKKLANNYYLRLLDQNNLKIKLNIFLKI